MGYLMQRAKLSQSNMEVDPPFSFSVNPWRLLATFTVLGLDGGICGG
jgi:hypothetical protein